MQNLKLNSHQLTEKKVCSAKYKSAIFLDEHSKPRVIQSMSKPQTSPYQQYYNSLLVNNSPMLPKLFTYRLKNQQQQNTNTSANIFPEVSQYPDFFEENLVSENRIIKLVNGEYCILRSFYFQLFKLLFQIEAEDTDYLETFKEIIFDPNILQNGSKSRSRSQASSSKGASSRVSKNSQHSNTSKDNSSKIKEEQEELIKCQKLLAEYIEGVVNGKFTIHFNSEGQGDQQIEVENFQTLLNLYPVIDQIMVILLQKMIGHCGEQLDSMQQILEYLCEIFQIELVAFDNCFKFEQSDVFLYVEQKQSDIWIYIAYNELMADSESQSQSSQQQSQSNVSNSEASVENDANPKNKESIKKQEVEKDCEQNSNSHQIVTEEIGSQNIENPSSGSKYSSSQKDNVVTSETDPLSSGKKVVEDIFVDRSNSGDIKEPNYEDDPYQPLSSEVRSKLRSEESLNFQLQNTIISSLPQNTATKNQFQSASIGEEQNPRAIPSTDQINESLSSESNALKQIKREVSQTEVYPIDQPPFPLKRTSSNQQSSSGVKVVGNNSHKKEQSENSASKVLGGSDSSFLINASRADTIINILGADMLKSSHHQNPNASSHFINPSGLKQDQLPHHDFEKGIEKGSLVTSRHWEGDYDQKTDKKPIQKSAQVLAQYGVSNYQQSATTNEMKHYDMTKKIRSEESIVFEATQPTTTQSSQQLASKKATQKHATFAEENMIIEVPQSSSKKETGKAQSQDQYQVKKGDFDSLIAVSQEGLSRSQTGDQTSPKEIPNQSIISKKSGQQQFQEQGLNLSRQRAIEDRRKEEDSHHSIRQSIKNYRSHELVSHQTEPIDMRPSQLSRAQTSIEEQLHDERKVKKSLLSKDPQHENENEEDEDDIFYRPSDNQKNSSAQQHHTNSYAINAKQRANSPLLNTITEVGASKQSFKDSAKLNDDNRSSQNSHQGHNLIKSPGVVASSYLNKLESVHSVTPDHQLSNLFETQKSHGKIGANSRIKVRNSPSDNSSLNKETEISATNNSSANGTFYKQFTNTRILNLLKQPYQTQVQILKNRFKGEHKIKRKNVGSGALF